MTGEILAFTVPAALVGAAVVLRSTLRRLLDGGATFAVTAKLTLPKPASDTGFPTEPTPAKGT